ncbi:DUF6379 domain-containing protein [Actinoplanes sp. NPDC051851]|uniref:C-glycoside deglycosidase beta subunit domain-containing protein n=1 Tax=Actinoplanes sp. NPDC051851 TaxID=3154753 RepID=UPI0034359F42
MFPERVIADGTLRAEPGAVSVEIRLPWYRALPLSSVSAVDVTLNGTPIAADDLELTVNDVPYLLSELPARHDVWWYVTDSARLRIPAASVEDEHTLSVSVALLIPYLPVEGAPLSIVERCTKTLEVAA